jgi:hypothetical protein
LKNDVRFNRNRLIQRVSLQALGISPDMSGSDQ